MMPNVLHDRTKSDRAARDDRWRRLEADLKVAERIHRSMIPASQRRGNLEIVCEFQPMIGVGGDYASVHFQSDQRVVVGICDVAGHGVASALLASRVNSFVLNHAPRVCHPCELVDSLNEFVFRTFRDADLYVTFFSLFLDLNKHTLLGAGCGHPPRVPLCQEGRRRSKSGIRKHDHRSVRERPARVFHAAGSL